MITLDHPLASATGNFSANVVLQDGDGEPRVTVNIIGRDRKDVLGLQKAMTRLMKLMP